MLEKINDALIKVLSPTVVEILLIVFALIPLVVLLVLLIFGGGLAKKISNGFKKVVKAEKKSNEKLCKAVDDLPPCVKSLVDNARFAGALPTEYATYSAVVVAPSALSSRKNAGIVIAITTLLCAFAQVLLVGMDEGIILLTLILGGLLSLVGALSSYAFIKKISKNYYKAMKILDARFMSEVEESTVETCETANASIDFDVEEKGYQEDTIENIEKEERGESIDEPVDYDHTVYADENDLGLDLDDYADVMRSEPIMDEPEKEDVIRRVEYIATYGASIDEMKEVAALLRLERAKPENRTPYRRKRLDDAFASLLRSATNAKK